MLGKSCDEVRMAKQWYYTIIFYRLTFRHHASYIYDRCTATPQSTLFVHSVNKYIYFFFFRFSLETSSFIPPQNVLYFLMLPILVDKIFTFYINGVLNCKFPAPEPKGWSHTCAKIIKNAFVFIFDVWLTVHLSIFNCKCPTPGTKG